MRISSHIDVYWSSVDEQRLFIENSMTYVFVNFRSPYLCPSEGHKYRVSIHSLINLSKTFLRISPARNIAQTWILATLFEYSRSFSSLILDLICWMVLMVVWEWNWIIRCCTWFFFSRNRLFSWIKYWKLWRKKCKYNVFYHSQNIASLNVLELKIILISVSQEQSNVLCIKSWQLGDTFRNTPTTHSAPVYLIFFFVFYFYFKLESRVEGPVWLLYYAKSKGQST